MARLLHGRPVAERINGETRALAAALVARGAPALAIVSVGADPAAVAYTDRLTRSGASHGVRVSATGLPRETTERELIETLERLGADPAVHGIVLMTPLPASLDHARLAERIPVAKDVEGTHPANVGWLTEGRPRFVPSTAEAVIELLRAYEIPIRGRHAVVVGRSSIVGRPTASLLLMEDATVTITHRKTPDMARLTREADIVVVAIGSAGWLHGDMIRGGATVIDAGINATPHGLTGDVDAESVAPVAGALSPVPGGLGAVTTALLLRNVVRAAAKQAADAGSG